ncbi:MAG: hypothetical protein ACYCZX_17185 [Rhodospirillaceae bacterium]
MTVSTAERTALELKYDGAIPAHLLETRAAVDLEIGHHRAIIRFSEARTKDFTESLGRLLARTPQDAVFRVSAANSREG